MFGLSKKNTGNLLLINLIIVSLIGVVMRYKIGFNFPYFNQKNLQHAHSHFAFTGWVSQSLLVLFVNYLQHNLNQAKINLLKKLLWANVLLAYGMLISFTASGYGVFSIIISTLSLLLFFYIAILSIQTLKSSHHTTSANYFKAAFLFGILSSIGTLSLSIIIATKQFDQHLYLASVYWYLHFQYNGYFFFMCMGLFINYLHQLNIQIPKNIFLLLFISTFFTYGLSVLWLKIPTLLFVIVIIATAMQSIAMFTLFYRLYQQKFLQKTQSAVIKFLFVFLFVAVSVKYLLQAGSTIPSLSHFAFGFRSVVIAYLHLVLLAIISVSIICFLVINHFIATNPTTTKTISIWCLFIFFNELILCVQGAASVTYTLIPFSNEMLFGIAVGLLGSVIFLLISKNIKNNFLEKN